MNVNDLAPEHRTLLLAGARCVRVARGEPVYVAGDRGTHIYVVADGRIKIVRTNPSGAEAIVGIRARGDVFGELAGLDGEIRTTSAIAIDRVEAHALDAAAFAALLEADAAIGYAFARGVARRLADAELELAELMGKSVPGRLVDALGRLAAEHGVSEPDGAVRIAINLTHKDLADLIGTSRETLTKELNVLADVGLLRVSHRSVTLVQPRAFPFARPSTNAR